MKDYSRGLRARLTQLLRGKLTPAPQVIFDFLYVGRVDDFLRTAPDGEPFIGSFHQRPTDDEYDGAFLASLEATDDERVMMQQALKPPEPNQQEQTDETA